MKYEQMPVQENHHLQTGKDFRGTCLFEMRKPACPGSHGSLLQEGTSTLLAEPSVLFPPPSGLNPAASLWLQLPF